MCLEDVTHRVIIAPNEDGYGTSAWVVLLARELARVAPHVQVRVLLSADKWQAFHRDKYPPDSGVTPVVLPGNPNRIAVVKQRHGAVDIRATVGQAVLSYPASRAAFEAAVAGQHVLAGVDLVVDLGVPQLVWSAYREALQRQARAEPQLVALTVFDHAWSMSLERIAAQEPETGPAAEAVQRALADMRRDEALARRAILFDEPICPREYHEYWRGLLRRSPAVIPGCLGGPLCTLAYAGDRDVAQARAQTEQRGACRPEAGARARRYARQLLGIHDDRRVLFVSGGGTPVWDEVLGAMLDDYARREPPYHVVIHNPAEAARRHLTLADCHVPLNGQDRALARATWGPNDCVTFIDRLAGETHHPLFAAFDLVLTRAGGGTVNNAIAFRVPLVLVEETGMWQVEQIRQACLRMGLAEGVGLAEFRARGRECVETPDGQLKVLAIQARRMADVPAHSETWLCRQILAEMR